MQIEIGMGASTSNPKTITVAQSDLYCPIVVDQGNWLGVMPWLLFLYVMCSLIQYHARTHTRSRTPIHARTHTHVHIYLYAYYFYTCYCCLDTRLIIFGVRFSDLMNFKRYLIARISTACLVCGRIFSFIFSFLFRFSSIPPIPTPLILVAVPVVSNALDFYHTHTHTLISLFLFSFSHPHDACTLILSSFLLRGADLFFLVGWRHAGKHFH